MKDKSLLTFNEVTAINATRLKHWHEDDDSWTGADWATALGGECGEALNVVKKMRRVETGLGAGKNDPSLDELRSMLAEELADTFLYLDCLATYYSIDLPAAIVHKFNKVSEVYGFSEML